MKLNRYIYPFIISVIVFLGLVVMSFFTSFSIQLITSLFIAYVVFELLVMLRMLIIELKGKMESQLTMQSIFGFTFRIRSITMILVIAGIGWFF